MRRASHRNGQHQMNKAEMMANATNEGLTSSISSAACDPPSPCPPNPSLARASIQKLFCWRPLEQTSEVDGISGERPYSYPFILFI